MNVYILLDRSGSMVNLWNEAVGSINAYVEKLPKKTKVHMAVFDNEYKVIRDTTAGEWKDVSDKDATPRGMTALFDASARIMQRAIDDDAEKTVVVVMTDGEENSSKNFKQSDVKALVSYLDEKKWEIVFLGANFDKVGDVAMSYGKGFDKFADMKAGNMRGFMATNLADATTAYVSGSAASINFSAEDKKAAGGK